MVLLICAAVLFAVASLIAIRNGQVFRFRISLNDRVYRLNMLDIQSGKEARPDRRDKLNSMSYTRMMLFFWKPLRPEAWWSDTSFLEEGE